MVSTPEKLSHKPSVRDLQGDVINCLEKIVELMGRAKDILSEERTENNCGEKYGEFQQEINNAVQNVKKLELRMAVVAPMKAGKSTIVNAIVGQDLLPSRNAAMTTLPTEIVFNGDIQQPVLILSEEVQQVFQNTLLYLKNKITEDGQEIIQEKTAQYPHLLELLEEIKAQTLSIGKGSLTGHENITEQLTKLNDIVRLCSVIDPTNDPLNHLLDVIRIETPFVSTQESNQTEQLGKLVVIDTPGPNEAGANLRLTAVVEEQLKRSSIVLIILDFTQLNNEAAEKVKKQVQPIIDLIGKDNLYVLVNKVDQRRKGDMSSEQVKEFVYADLNLSESIKTERVFEIAAIRAFAAAKYLLEYQQNSHLDSHENATVLKTAEVLAQEVFGIDWEEDLEEATIKDLQKKAKRLWTKSGFDLFLEKAINALVENAAPCCMLSALNLSRSRLLHITDDLKLRNSAITKDEHKLREEIDALEADLKRIELCRMKLRAVDKIKESLRQNLNEALEILKEQAQVNIEDYFREEDYRRASAIQKVDMKMREILLSNILNFNPFGFDNKIKSAIEYKSPNQINFKTKQAADRFSNDAMTWAKDRAEAQINLARSYTSKEIEKARKGLIEFLDKETKPIIDKARNRLSKAFDIELSFPEIPDWKDDYLTQPQISVNHSTRQKKVQRSDKKRRWYVLWLWQVEHTWQETVHEHIYSVSLNSLVNTFNRSITEAVDQINSEVIQYIDEEIKKANNYYFDHLDQYICRYRDSLKQAQQDQQLSLEQKNELTQNLSNLIPESSNYIEKVDSYLEKTKSLMPRSTENFE